MANPVGFFQAQRYVSLIKMLHGYTTDLGYPNPTHTTTPMDPNTQTLGQTQIRTLSYALKMCSTSWDTAAYDYKLQGA